MDGNSSSNVSGRRNMNVTPRPCHGGPAIKWSITPVYSEGDNPYGELLEDICLGKIHFVHLSQIYCWWKKKSFNCVRGYKLLRARRTKAKSVFARLSWPCRLREGFGWWRFFLKQNSASWLYYVDCCNLRGAKVYTEPLGAIPQRSDSPHASKILSLIVCPFISSHHPAHLSVLSSSSSFIWCPSQRRPPETKFYQTVASGPIKAPAALSAPPEHKSSHRLQPEGGA